MRVKFGLREEKQLSWTFTDEESPALSNEEAMIIAVSNMASALVYIGDSVRTSSQALERLVALQEKTEA